MLFPQLEEKLQASKQALNTATTENIIERCKQQLAEAVEIFNQRSYEGHDDWELRASGV